MIFYKEKLCILRKGRHGAMKIENDMPEKNRGFAGTYSMRKLSKNNSPWTRSLISLTAND